MHPSVILHLEGVTKQFSPAIAPAVASINLSLNVGEILVFLGPSGCGKTTLLRLIAGFEQPQLGTIEINGKIVAGLNQWIPPEQRDVGMVFQDYALFPHLTVAKNIAFGLRQGNKKFETKRQIASRVTEVISLVSLEGLENRYPHQLSGGQQQRVALARALAPRPALVLLDEPLSNLDAQIRLKLRQELRDILKAAGTSAIFVTHDQEEAFAISDRVAIMQNGHIEQIGTALEIYQMPRSRFVAEFVTQANFVTAHYRGRLWETELGSFALPDLSQQDIPQGTQVELMIRQEDLQIHPDEQADVVICDRIFLGRELIYHLRTASGQVLVARTTSKMLLPVGICVKVTVEETALYAFPIHAKALNKQPLAI
ncbi:ABC transporter ATP-binding protein [Tumidithrix elongata RA019]|uniref:ABC-type quaternary amine transporter n=1 Tax=Tumidithrix elongata BACA0141 TaxID=2716417 RepID=A0AAW9PZZ1_9CYAN|nr:ABC transporter ATP-binding protein [Tumidithrix elongata RA019]